MTITIAQQRPPGEQGLTCPCQAGWLEKHVNSPRMAIDVEKYQANLQFEQTRLAR